MRPILNILKSPWRAFVLYPLIHAYGYLTIPWQHRRWLMTHERAFQREIKSRWPTEKYSSITLHNWPVGLFVDLLNRPAGGMAYCGGPVFVSKSRLPVLRHFRGSRCIDDPLELDEAQIRDGFCYLLGRQFWCGPVCHHFGHQIADFGSRALLSSIDPRPGGLLWQHFAPGCDDRLKTWQESIIRYLNPGAKQITWLEKPTVVERLEVWPQQARMHSAPTFRHLAALSWLQTELSDEPSIDFLYVSRSRFAAGRNQETMLGSFAAELEFESLLHTAGVFILHPEECNLQQQLDFYRSAQCIIVAEGSAQHGLELLGFDEFKDVLVICRRSQKEGMELPLKARFPRVHFLEFVRELWVQEGGVPWNGLALLQWELVISELKSFGIALPLNSATNLENSSQRQLANLASHMRLISFPLE